MGIVAETRRFVTMLGDIISGTSDEVMLFYSAWNLYCLVHYVGMSDQTGMVWCCGFLCWSREKRKSCLCTTPSSRMFRFMPTKLGQGFLMSTRPGANVINQEGQLQTDGACQGILNMMPVYSQISNECSGDNK
eukprot:g30443.t1